MKTHIIKTNTAELLVVELPKDSTFREIFGLIGAVENNNPNYHLAVYNFSDYTLLGKPDEVSEEDVELLVEKSIHTGLFAHYVKDIPVNTYCYKTAKESLLSLLESEIYWEVNPYGEEPLKYTPDEGSDYIPLHTIWHEAQRKTFDRNRTIIFKKSKQ